MKTFFLFLLILRSSLDIFTDVGVNVGPMNLNIPSMASIFILLPAGFYFILRGGFQLPVIGKFFNFWLLFLAFSVLISFYIFGLEGAAALREWVRLVTIFVIFVLAYNLIEKKDFSRFLNAVFWSLPIPLSFGMHQLITGSGGEYAGVVRIAGTFAHPNPFAFYLVLFIALTFWKWQFSEKKVFWTALLLVQLLLLTATLTLAGFIMFAVLFAGILMKTNKRAKVLVLLSGVLFAVVLVNTDAFQERVERVRLINFQEAAREDKVVDSFTWRIVNWKGLLVLWQERPLLGYGLNSATVINPLKNLRGEGFTPHNDYVNYTVETGLVGLLMYLIFLLALGLSIYRGYLLAEDREIKSLMYMLFVVFAALQIGSFSSDVSAGTALQFYFWAVAGAGLKAVKTQYEDSPDKSIPPAQTSRS